MTAAGLHRAAVALQNLALKGDSKIMSMKARLAGLIAAFALVVASSARAANVCLTLGAAQIVASGLTIPAKGACTSFNGFFRGKDNAGKLLAGDICKSSDGTSVMFNTFTQQNFQPDSLVGSWSTSTLAGSAANAPRARAASRSR